MNANLRKLDIPEKVWDDEFERQLAYLKDECKNKSDQLSLEIVICYLNSGDDECYDFEAMTVVLNDAFFNKNKSDTGYAIEVLFNVFERALAYRTEQTTLKYFQEYEFTQD